MSKQTAVAITSDAEALEKWASVARAHFPAPILLHRRGDSYELHCGTMKPFRLQALHPAAGEALLHGADRVS